MKAYDRTPISKLLLTLRKFGFHESFVTLIDLLYTNCKGYILTAYGPTESFSLSNGVRQGDPLSCLLFLIFLQPLIYYMKHIVPSAKVLGCADDLAAIVKLLSKGSAAVGAASDFLQANCMELSIDDKGKSKTAHMHNELDENGQPKANIRVHYRKADGTQVPIPVLGPNEDYRYLGIHINLNKDWTRQYIILRNSLRSQARWLSNRCYTVAELATIVKSIMLPHLEFCLRICSFTDQQLNELACCLTSVIYRKLGFRRPPHQTSHDSPLHLQIGPEHFGLDLPTVRTWGKAIKIVTILDNGFNAKNQMARDAAEYLWTSTTEFRIDIHEALRTLKLKLVPGESLYRDPLLIKSWLTGAKPEFISDLQRFSVTNLSHIFREAYNRICVNPVQYELRGPGRQPCLLRSLRGKGLESDWRDMKRTLTDGGGKKINPQIR